MLVMILYSALVLLNLFTLAFTIRQVLVADKKKNMIISEFVNIKSQILQLQAENKLIINDFQDYKNDITVQIFNANNSNKKTAVKQDEQHTNRL
jgi:hypothetical protein